MKFLKVIFLYPISLIYGLVINVRNTLFDFKILKSKTFDIPIISVGNITVGGTGKTPTTEYIIKTLQENYKIAVLSRGYKRKTKGFILANSNSTIEQIGDEPFQIKQKFPNITVAVDKKRVHGIEELQKTNRNLELIILDDAFQHRKVTPDFSILLIDYTQPFFEDSFLPYGRLRDSHKEKHRANVMLVTKAPKDVKPIEMRIMATNLELKAYQTLYFSSIKYNNLMPVYNSGEQKKNIASIKQANYSIILVTGIGNFKPIFSYCENLVKDFIHLKFPDHHKYTQKDIKNISEKFNRLKSENKMIITTEKDAVKIRDISCNNKEMRNSFFYCPIEIEILNDEKEDFEKQLINIVKKGKEQYRFLTSKKQY